MVLLIGATGKIGRHVAQRLAESGVESRALVRDPARAHDLAAAGVQIVQGELTDDAALTGALGGVSKLYLALGGAPDQEALETRVIDAAASAGVGHIVKLSATGAAPDSIVALGRWHHAIESHLQASGVDWTILRPNFFMENLLGSAESIAGEGKLYGNAGDGATTFIDGRDIADVAFAALTSTGHESKTYALTGPEAFTHAQVAALIGAATGREVQYVDVPDDAWGTTLTGFGVPHWLAADLVALGQVQRNGWVAATTTDVTTATGNAPRTLAAFVAEHAATFGG